MRLGAIEAGGTKIICGIGDETGRIEDSVSFPTRDPAETVAQILEYFAHQPLDGLGIASFGPVEVNTSSPNYGTITTTPKLAWQNFNWFEALRTQVHCPIFIDTDVNAAALGEARFGAAVGLANCIYITVGTGIGGGLLAEGNLVHGLMHPEVGHMLIRRHPDDSYQGHCPFHHDCLEGLASGPALEARWGQKAETLDSSHPAWTFESYYLAQAIVNLILVSSTQKVILGGGVMHQPQLITKIREQVLDMLSGYIAKEEVTQNIEGYIVKPGLGDSAGLTGALALTLKH